MKKTAYLAILCISLFLISADLKSQALSDQDIKAYMIKEWERAKTYTVDYLNTMPADKYGFKAVDSLRSFANQMLHLATGNVFLMMTATDAKPPSWFNPNLEHSPTAQGKDSVMYYVVSSYDYCIGAIKGLDVNKWGQKKKIFGFEETRYAMINKTFEHQTHHRGQTTIYIRLVNVRPPQERLFEMEN